MYIYTYVYYNMYLFRNSIFHLPSVLAFYAPRQEPVGFQVQYVGFKDLLHLGDGTTTDLNNKPCQNPPINGPFIESLWPIIVGI